MKWDEERENASEEEEKEEEDTNGKTWRGDSFVQDVCASGGEGASSVYRHTHHRAPAVH